MEFFGIGASDGSTAKVVGSARLLLVIGAVTAIFAISGTADPSWVSASNTESVAKNINGDMEDVTARFGYGLTEAISSQPVFLVTLDEKYTAKSSVSPNAAILGASTGNTFGTNDGPALTDGSESVSPVLGMMVAGLIFFFVSLILLVLQFFTSTTYGGAKGGLVMYYATGALGVLSGLLFLVGAIVFATAEDKDVVCWNFENNDTLKDPSCGFGAAFALSLIAGLLGIVYGIVYFVLLKIASVAVVKGAGAVAEAASKA